MPISGKGVYKGKAAGVVPTEEYDLAMTGDVSLDADFATREIDGSISNIAATALGVTVPVSGTMAGSSTIIGSGFDIPIIGEITVDGDEYLSTGYIFGDFKGTDASAVAGGIEIDGENFGDFTAVKQ